MKEWKKTCGHPGAMPVSETSGSLIKGIRVYMLSVGEPDFPLSVQKHLTDRSY